MKLLPATTDAAGPFGSILAGLSQQPEQLRRAAYVSALRSMDWAFEYSDDHSSYTEGRARLQWLCAELKAVDPDAAIARATVDSIKHLAMLGVQ